MKEQLTSLGQVIQSIFDRSNEKDRRGPVRLAPLEVTIKGEDKTFITMIDQVDYESDCDSLGRTVREHVTLHCSEIFDKDDLCNN